jgi:hypothetical protein
MPVLKLPYLANKNMGHPAKFKTQFFLKKEIFDKMYPM